LSLKQYGFIETIQEGVSGLNSCLALINPIYIETVRTEPYKGYEGIQEILSIYTGGEADYIVVRRTDDKTETYLP